jgi:hypothetical protein
MARADLAQRSRPRRLIAGTGTYLWAGPGRLLAATSRRRRRRPAPPAEPVATVRAPARGEPTSFLIQGTVDGEPATARWRPASGLVCSAEVLRRALLVVALGDSFGAPDERTPVPASLLDSPTSLFLTVLRAFSRVASVDVVVKGSGPITDEAAEPDADVTGVG